MTIMDDMDRTKENNGENSAPLPHSNRESSKEYNRLTDIEVKNRVDECIQLRYHNPDRPILQREWIDYCKETYGDKSVPQYINYWMKAKSEYDEAWKGKLEGLLEPAIQELREGLRSDNHYVRSKTVDQIFKYSGNDVQKHHHLVQQINIGFDTE